MRDHNDRGEKRFELNALRHGDDGVVEVVVEQAVVDVEQEGFENLVLLG